jgi:hypothetical protein
MFTVQELGSDLHKVKLIIPLNVGGGGALIYSIFQYLISQKVKI